MKPRRLLALCAALGAIAALIGSGLAGQGRMDRRGAGGPVGRRGIQRGGARGTARRAIGRPARRGAGWRYDRDKETTLSGVVVETQARGEGPGLLSGLAVRLEDGEVRRVRLAPPWYLDQLGLHPKVNDSVQVVGVPRDEPEVGEVIARELTWNGQVYQLRTTPGAPLWAGARRQAWSRYCSLWDPSGAAEVTGEIEAIESFSPGGADMGRGVSLRLRTKEEARERVQVHLGPSWFVQEKLPGLEIGEQITAKGCSAHFGRQDVIIASEVERNRNRIRMRTKEGHPEWAGGWQNWDGWAPGAHYARKYDPNTVRTVSGTVQSADRGAPFTGMGAGVMFNLRTQEQQQIRAHVAPVWFLEQADFSLSPGDEVTLTGSMIDIGGKQIMMVRRIQADSRQLEVRQEDGTPVWAGPRLAHPTPPG